MMCLADSGGKSADTNAITAHDWCFALSVLIHISHLHGFRIFISKLEDVSDLDSSGNTDRLFSAFRADTALICLCKIMIFCIRHISLHIKSLIMVLVLICTTGKVISVF